MSRRWVLAYALNVLAVLPVAILLGFSLDMYVDKYYYLTPWRDLALCSICMAGMAGYFVTHRLQWRPALFVWVPALVVFVYVAWSLANAWNPAWAGVSRATYVWRGLVGPGCGAEECVYTFATDLFLSSVAYSASAWLALSKGRRTREPDTRADDQLRRPNTE